MSKSRAVCKTRLRLRNLRSRRRQHAQARLESGRPERDEHARRREPLEVLFQVAAAVLQLRRRRLVVRRRAAAGGGQQSSLKLQPVAARDRGRLIREADRVERGKEKVARLVSREHPAGAIGAVPRGGEPDDEDPPRGVPERRDGPCPVPLPRKTPRRISRRLFPPRHESRAAAAGDEPHFLAGSPLGTPIERQRFFFSSQSSSARLRFTAAAEARRSSSFGRGGVGLRLFLRFRHGAILPTGRSGCRPSPRAAPGPRRSCSACRRRGGLPAGRPAA